MKRFVRAELVEKFHAMARAGEPIIGAGAGTGLSAKCEEAGGVDLIVIYNSGRYRMAGRGSLAGLLAYGNANDVVVEMAAEVLPVVEHTPVLAGVNGTDPFMLADRFLRELADLGFAGIQNFPTVGLIDGMFRANLEETGMGYGLEVDLIKAAHAADLLTTPYVFSAADARAMTRAGADIIVCHMGLTAGGSIGGEDNQVARRVCRADRRMGRGRAQRTRRRARPVPRRTDRDARRRRSRNPRGSALPRILRRVVNGTPARGVGAHGADSDIQTPFGTRALDRDRWMRTRRVDAGDGSGRRRSAARRGLAGTDALRQRQSYGAPRAGRRPRGTRPGATGACHERSSGCSRS